MMEESPQQMYLEARVEGAKTLAESYEHYQARPECFIAGVQYALDHILSRTQGLHDLLGGSVGNVLHANAVDILTQVKERRL
jgi:hypothetical protein